MQTAVQMLTSLWGEAHVLVEARKQGRAVVRAVDHRVWHAIQLWYGRVEQHEWLHLTIHDRHVKVGYPEPASTAAPVPYNTQTKALWCTSYGLAVFNCCHAYILHNSSILGTYHTQVAVHVLSFNGRQVAGLGQPERLCYAWQSPISHRHEQAWNPFFNRSDTTNKRPQCTAGASPVFFIKQQAFLLQISKGDSRQHGQHQPPQTAAVEHLCCSAVHL